MPARRSSRESEERSRAARVLRRHRTRLLRRDGVCGVGVGRRWQAGERRREVCIRVYVRSKRPPEALAPNALLPERIQGVPVDVVEADFRAAACRDEAWLRREVRDPLQGGLEVGAAGRGPGTLALLWRGADGLVYGLTCDHVAVTGQVLAQNAAAGGDVGQVTVGVRNGSADLDAALALLDPAARGHAAGVYQGPAAVSVSNARPRERDPVVVQGACSGEVAGEVDDDSASPRVVYADKTVLYRDQVLVRIRPDLVRQGDSGSLVFDASGTRAWGVLIAIGGAGQHELGVVTPLARILAHASFQPGGAPLVPFA